jgi:flavin-dependent dehydrogenase
MLSADAGSYDVIVVGGGPGGTAAAIAAARLPLRRPQGPLRILMLERTSYPRAKVCGEFVSPEALEVLPSLLPGCSALLHDAPRIVQVRLVAEGQIVTFPVHPAAASIPRWKLDHALWRAAASAGVDCRERVEVRRVDRLDTRFVVSTAAGAFVGRSVIDASGRWSRLRFGHENSRKHLRDQTRWIGLKSHFLAAQETNENCGAAAGITDLYFFAGGYCGVQPVGSGQLNVCAMVRSDCATCLPEVFKLHPDLHQRSRNWAEATKPVAAAPLIFSGVEAEREGMLCVGDAAAFIDPFVGDGISLALRSGILAAQALAPFWSGEIVLAEALRRYVHEHDRRFRRPLRTAALARAFLLAPAAIRRLALRAMQSPRFSRYLVRSTR